MHSFLWGPKGNHQCSCVPTLIQSTIWNATINPSRIPTSTLLWVPCPPLPHRGSLSWSVWAPCPPGFLDSPLPCEWRNISPSLCPSSSEQSLNRVGWDPRAWQVCTSSVPSSSGSTHTVWWLGQAKTVHSGQSCLLDPSRGSAVKESTCKRCNVGTQ